MIKEPTLIFGMWCASGYVYPDDRIEVRAHKIRMLDILIYELSHEYIHAVLEQFINNVTSLKFDALQKRYNTRNESNIIEKLQIDSNGIDLIE